MQHDKVFVDTNFIIELIAGNEKVKSFFEKTENLCINAVVLSETIFILLKIRTGLSANALKKKKKIARENFSEVIELLPIFEILPITEEATRNAVNMIAAYNLLPNDALIAATCKANGITKIATFDEDFKRVDFIEVVEV